MSDPFLPTACHLWQNGDPTMEQLRDALATLKEYADDPHLMRQLKKCKQCGQLYFYEFYEWVDWEGGNDPQYRSWIPVQTEGEADALNELSPLGLLRFPGIRSDYPAEANKPGAPKWSVKK